MGKRKPKAKATALGVLDGVSTSDFRPGFLDFGIYAFIATIHATLLGLIALFLPRTALPFIPLPDPSARTSQDRPQLPFLDPLTLNPLSTVACICIGTIGLQSWWGGWLREWGRGLFSNIERDSVKHADQRSAWLATLAASFLCHVVLVLFGAHISSHHLHTYLLALNLCLLTFFTPAYAIGVPTFNSNTRITWIRLFAQLSPRNTLERAIVYPAIGAIVGCWTGVVPIALDWDRPWQAWPLTPMYGAILGNITGSLLAVIINWFKSATNEPTQIGASTKVKSS